MDTTGRDEAGALYEEDFYAWTQNQASLLRSGALECVDIANIIEEIETLGRSELNALRSRYAILCAHLLKSAVRTVRQGRSWELTIAEQRVQIARLLQDNPGLKSRKAALFGEGYEDGRKLAAAETGIAIAAFAETPPFTIDQAESETWHPGAPRCDPTPRPSR